MSKLPTEDTEQVSESTNQVFNVRIPKDEFVQAFTFYVLDPGGDQYEKRTSTQKIEFNPQDLVIDIYNQGTVERSQNVLPSQIYDFEMLLGKAEVLLQALEREEQIYQAKLYNDVSDKKLGTETAKKNYLLASSFEDPTGILFNKYIAKSKYDTMALRTVIKALISHQFKCKMLYQGIHGNKKINTPEF
jgi:hypothetical protein